MTQHNYIPQPIDTATIKLPAELEPLVEQMVKNFHRT